MDSASESELASLFYNYKAALPLIMILEEMGHPQPKTSTVTDSSTAEGLINKTTVPKCAKYYDMNIKWLKYREAQEQFDFLIWKIGPDSRTDHHIKCHRIKVYQGKRGNYVMSPAAQPMQ